MKVCSNAKINLSLNVTGISNGLHLLDMIVVSVSHADTIVISPRTDGQIRVRASCCPSIKPLVKSTAHSVASQLFLPQNNGLGMGKEGECGANIFVRKQVLKSGGIGGSGTVTAGIFRGWGKMSNYNVSSLEGQMLAFKWGSDLPALITGGFMRVKGCGEVVEKLGNFPTYYFVLSAGRQGVNTAESFSVFDDMFAENPSQFLPYTANNNLLVSALKEGNFDEIGRHRGNMLYPCSRRLNAEIDHTLNCLRDSGARVCGMSGSGATCFGMYASEGQASQAQQSLLGRGLTAVLAHSLNSVG